MDQLGLEETLAGRISALLVSIESVRQSNDWSASRAASEIAAAAGSPAESDEERADLANRVEQVLDLPAVRLASDLTEAYGAHERTLRGLQFFVDFRAVEDSNGEIAGVVLTTLELSYRARDGETRRTYVVLDDDDLEALAIAVEDAQARAETVTRRLQKAGFRVADTGAPRGDADGPA
jgi:hypothetical protein